MINKILALFTILGLILTGLLVYANTAYFPAAKGCELEQRVSGIESNVNTKLDTVITMLQKDKK